MKKIFYTLSKKNILVLVFLFLSPLIEAMEQPTPLTEKMQLLTLVVGMPPLETVEEPKKSPQQEESPKREESQSPKKESGKENNDSPSTTSSNKERSSFSRETTRANLGQLTLSGSGFSKELKYLSPEQSESNLSGDDWASSTPRSGELKDQKNKAFLETASSGLRTETEGLLNEDANLIPAKRIIMPSSFITAFTKSAEKNLIVITDLLIKHPISKPFITMPLIRKEFAKAMQRKNTIMIDLLFPEIGIAEMRRIYIEALEEDDQELVHALLLRINMGIELGYEFAYMEPTEVEKITLPIWQNRWIPQLKKALSPISQEELQRTLVKKKTYAPGDEKEYLQICCCIGNEDDFFQYYFSLLIAIDNQAEYIQKLTNVFKNKLFKIRLLHFLKDNKPLKKLLETLFSRITQDKDFMQSHDHDIIAALDLFFDDSIFIHLQDLNLNGLKSRCCINGISSTIQDLVKLRLAKKVAPILEEKESWLPLPESSPHGSPATTVISTSSSPHSSPTSSTITLQPGQRSRRPSKTTSPTSSIIDFSELHSGQYTHQPSRKTSVPSRPPTPAATTSLTIFSEEDPHPETCCRCGGCIIL